MNEEFRKFAEDYGAKLYGSKFVFYASRQSGLSSAGDDLLAAFLAGQAAERKRWEGVAREMLTDTTASVLILAVDEAKDIEGSE